MQLLELSRLPGHAVLLIDFDRTLTAADGPECHTLFDECWPDDYDGADWWTFTHGEIVRRHGGTLTKPRFDEMVAKSGIRLTPSAVALLKEAQCRVIIVSAGLRDVIETVLLHHEVRGIEVISNEILWKDDVLHGITEPPLTSHGKSQIGLKALGVAAADLVIAIGDQKADTDLASITASGSGIIVGGAPSKATDHFCESLEGVKQIPGFSQLLSRQR